MLPRSIIGERPEARALDDALAAVKEEKGNGKKDEPAVDTHASRLAAVAGRHACFSVSLRGAGAFPSPDFARAVWVGIGESAPFVSLVREVRDQLASFRKEEHDALQIHLTVARVRPPKNREQLAQVIRQFSAEGFGSFVAERLVLYESTLLGAGAAYRAVRAFPLKTAF